MTEEIKLPPEEISRLERLVAAHEAGHCMYAWHQPKMIVRWVAMDISKGIGMTEVAHLVRELEDPEDIMSWLGLYMAGIAGEAAILGKFGSAEAALDLQNARSLAFMLSGKPNWQDQIHKVICQYPGPDRLDISAAFRNRQPRRIQYILRAGYRWARGHMQDRHELLFRLSAVLFMKKQLHQSEIASILGEPAYVEEP